MTDRILSQHGNVIAADFKPTSPSLDLTVALASEVIYCDGHVTLIRTVGSIDGKPVFVIHTLGDLATGNSTTL